ncbi:MAG: beta-lactamase family protein [Bacteroidia bacterium]|nr:beta-lactamase family protein [Bacteroidia bacterium]MBT8279717.1 beta-lactamase family protein [Bacteroidia bacterium]NND26719.1 serine hydrolase [Flavobacteriaceae bacterium]NNL32648.1 serine hydrolase [Flavobacteriaceae bacterium]
MKYLITLIIALYCFDVQGQDISNQIDDYAKSYNRTGDFSGCIQISKKGLTIYENCFGNANYSFNIPNQPETKFKIGSISKQLTAAAILILEQDGKINTTDTLSKFYPWSKKTKNITIEHLLTHTSGVTDIFNIPNFFTLSSQKKSISDLSKMILDIDLEFEPGTQYQYSNGGYALLAQLIEKLSGVSYQEFLNTHIFKPLNMTATGHGKGNEVIFNLAIGYDPSGYKGLKITDYVDPELLKGSGSIFSTVGDMQIWINSLKNKTLLNIESYEKLLNNYGHNYGYGISLYKSFDQSVFGHDGRINGFIADYLHYKETDLSIIILGNIQTGVSDFFRRDIAAITLNKDYKSRAKSILPANQNTIEKEKIIGTYSFGPNFNVYIENIEGKIQARANEGGYSELVLLKDGRFFSRTLYSYIEFKTDDKGAISKMVWTNNDGNSFDGLKK